MKLANWHWAQGIWKLLATRRLEPTRQAERIVTVQLNIVLPAKAGVIAVVLYYVFLSGWAYEVESIRQTVQEALKWYLFVYIFCNLIAAGVLWFWRKFPPEIFQWLVFTLGLLDGLFVAGLTLVTGGFSSIAYWIFPALIVLNAMSIPLATPQIVLNLCLSGFYLAAGFLTPHIGENQTSLLFVPGQSTPHVPEEMRQYRRTNAPPQHRSVPTISRISRSLLSPEDEERNRQTSFLLQSVVLWLFTLCCYGVQVLMEKQRREMEEAREFAVREGQIRSAGRLAAEFAHQIKNPLAIITNAAFSLERAVRSGRNNVEKQIHIIQEEVEHSDRIVTQIMGYAQLTEGRVEKLDVVEELDNAINAVFPSAAGYPVQLTRDYQADLPSLLMQRRHFSDIMVNLLQNAREALDGQGKITVTARSLWDESVEIGISDDGPGIAPEKIERIFEAYYSTKAKGSGIGLSVVKRDVELYCGTVHVESELGKGARFVLNFPAKTVMGPQKQQ